MRKEYVLELEKEGYVYVSGYDSSRYDLDWIDTPRKTWIIRRESHDQDSYIEFRDLFNVIRKSFNKRLPGEFTFDDGEEPEKETYMIDREFDNHGNVFAIISEGEDRKSTTRKYPGFETVHMERLLPYSIRIAHMTHLEFEFARRIGRGRQVVETLLRETFPDLTFEWAKPYVPPPPLTPEERQERDRQVRIENQEQPHPA